MHISAVKLGAVIVLAATAARAETYSTPIDNFLLDPSADYAEGIFDFGFRFTRVDTVRMEMVVPGGLPSGYGTGSACSFTYLVAALYDLGQTPNFNDYYDYLFGADDDEAPQPYPSLFGTFSHNLPGPDPQAYFSPLNATNQLNVPPPTPQWPSFVLEGKGSVAAQQVTYFSCYLNCSDSGVFGHPPPNVFSPRLVVEGVAAPEPALQTLLCAIFVIRFRHSHRGRWRYTAVNRTAINRNRVPSPGTCRRALHHGIG